MMFLCIYGADGFKILYFNCVVEFNISSFRSGDYWVISTSNDNVYDIFVKEYPHF